MSAGLRQRLHCADSGAIAAAYQRDSSMGCRQVFDRSCSVSTTMKRQSRCVDNIATSMFRQRCDNVATAAEDVHSFATAATVSQHHCHSGSNVSTVVQHQCDSSTGRRQQRDSSGNVSTGPPHRLQCVDIRSAAVSSQQRDCRDSGHRMAQMGTTGRRRAHEGTRGRRRAKESTRRHRRAQESTRGHWRAHEGTRGHMRKQEVREDFGGHMGHRMVEATPDVRHWGANEGT